MKRGQKVRERGYKMSTLAIGYVSERTGLAVSAIRFYESAGLISSTRASSGHRRFPRSVLRRLSFIRVCKTLGYSLEEIHNYLDLLPSARTPTESDWSEMAQQFAADIESRIAGLQRLREKLDSCIGCGCLSLEQCAILNPDDTAAQYGDGPRWLLGEE